MARMLLLAIAASLTLAGVAAAQAPSVTPAEAPSASPSRPTGTGTGTGAARGAPYTSTPTATVPRATLPGGGPRRRTYEFCNRDAQVRRLRGAERRHFVSRCQLGYGRPLFRRRGSVPN